MGVHIIIIYYTYICSSDTHYSYYTIIIFYYFGIGRGGCSSDDAFTQHAGEKDTTVWKDPAEYIYNIIRRIRKWPRPEHHSARGLCVSCIFYIYLFIFPRWLIIFTMTMFASLARYNRTSYDILYSILLYVHLVTWKHR